MSFTTSCGARCRLSGLRTLAMSPACWPSLLSLPCFFCSGLKWGPAEVKGGSHLPTACTWKACSPGGRPLSASAIRTPERVCVSSAVPTSLPSADLSSAAAESDGVAADFLAAAPSLALCALAAADAATSSTADAAMNRYMIATSVLLGGKEQPAG